MVPPDGYTTTERPSQDVISLTIRELSNILPNRVSTSMAVREQYATDFSFHKISPADAVVTAHTSDEVSSIVKI